MNHLLPPDPPLYPSHANPTRSSVNGVLAEGDHVGCTPLIDAIKADEQCQRKKERLLKTLKNEEASSSLLQNGTTISSRDTLNQTPSAVSTTSKATPQLSHGQKKQPSTPEITTNYKPGGGGQSDKGKENSSQANVGIMTTPVGIPSTSKVTSENLDARKLRQAQRKEEWLRRHKQKDQEEIQNNMEIRDIHSGGGEDALITDGNWVELYTSCYCV